MTHNAEPSSGTELRQETPPPGQSSRKKLLGNITSLTLLQAANYVLPLVTVPYLVRTLGVDRFGLLAFAQAFSQYFVVLTDYGFNLTAVPRIAVHAGDRRAVSEVFSLVMTVKLGLTVLSLVLMLSIVALAPKFSAESGVFYASFLMVVGSVMFPMWLFQGLEEMHYITILNISAKLAATAAIFVFVHHRTDYVLAAGLQSGGFLLAGVLGLAVARWKLKVRWVRWRDLTDARAVIKEGGQVFIATISANVYGQGAVLVTGLVAGNAAAGYYAIAQKIGWALSTVAQPVAQATYPRLCALYSRDAERHKVINRRFVGYGVLFSALLAAALMLAAVPVARVVAKDASPELVLMIRAYAGVMFFITLNVLLTPLMLSMKAYRANQRIAIAAAILFLICSIPLTKLYGGLGMAVTIFAVEFLIFTGILHVTGILRGPMRRLAGVEE